MSDRPTDKLRRLISDFGLEIQNGPQPGQKPGVTHDRMILEADAIDSLITDLRAQLAASQERVGELEETLRAVQTNAERKHGTWNVTGAVMNRVDEALASRPPYATDNHQ